MTPPDKPSLAERLLKRIACSDVNCTIPECVEVRAIAAELRKIAEEIRANRARYGSKTTLPAWADRLAKREK